VAKTQNRTETSRHHETSPRRHPVLIVVGSAERIDLHLSDAVFQVGPIFSIGRDSRDADPGDGQGWRPADRLVSTQHARIVRGPNGIEIEDRGSTNGTYLNGVRVSGPTPVGDGDVIFAGAQAAVVRFVTDQQLDAIRDEQKQPFTTVASTSPAMAVVCRKLRLLAPSQTEILLTGETGVGKEVFAHAIHRASGRPGPFVAINCAAIPRDLVESELFGYTRGAHSQAVRAKRGLLQGAEGGTLFLDEIGEMPADAQAKLLRFLQTRRFTALGDTAATSVDVRIIAATNRGLISGNAFGLRPDLAARLGAQPVALPPLRNRIEDLARLSAHFLEARPRPVEVAAFRAMCLHRWPGNVRELEKTLAEAILLVGDAPRIGLQHLPDALNPACRTTAPTPASPRTRRRPAPPKEALEELLAAHQGNVADVARSLDRQWAVVWRCIVRHGIDVERFRKP
jgi:transcriptional regulator with PAS, ATPase and Fis domain